MQKVYYVVNKTTKKVLNQKGEWSEKLTSYRLAEFASEDEAKAAFPPGVACTVATRNKKESDQ